MQLPLFENLWQDKANRYLDELNEGRKGKDVFSAGKSLSVDGCIIISVVNGYGNHLYKIVDEFGNIPTGFSACWRHLSYLQEDIKISYTVYK